MHLWTSALRTFRVAALSMIRPPVRMSVPEPVEPYPCDLCGLPVEVDDFALTTVSGPKRFCCEGCYGIFQMLHEDEIVTEPER